MYISKVVVGGKLLFSCYNVILKEKKLKLIFSNSFIF